MIERMSEVKRLELSQQIPALAVAASGDPNAIKGMMSELQKGLLGVNEEDSDIHKLANRLGGSF